MSVAELTVLDEVRVGGAAEYLADCLQRVPPGRGVPPFLHAQAGGSLATVLEATLVDLPPMHIFDPAAGRLDKDPPVRGQAYAQYIIGLRDGVLLNPEGQVASAAGLVLIESMRDTSLIAAPDYSGANLADPRHLAGIADSLSAAPCRDGRWLTLVYAPARNWYHWLIETAGRIPAAQCIPDFGSLNILVPPGLTQNHHDVLTALGVDPARLVVFDGNPTRFEELYLPSFASMRGSYHPVALSVLRSKLAASLDLPKSGRRRLYLSRADAAIRRVANESEILDGIGPLGFEKFALADRSLREQAVGFAEAEIIIAPHGAGLANLLFARPGTLVIELLPVSADGYLTLYHALSAALGLRYIALRCPADGAHADFVADPRGILTLLAGLAGIVHPSSQ